MRVVVRNKARRVATGFESTLLATDPVAAAAEPCDLVVELIGGEDCAADAIESALESGKAVVTANKALIASRGQAFEETASRARAALRYSAAVGGAVPMLELLRQCSADGGESDPVTGVRGIVNGTCNFVLDQLEHGMSFEDAVALAQASGFAEADPTSDLSGADSAAKLAILARVVNSHRPAGPPHYAGIDAATARRVRAARRSGNTLRLVATMSCTADRTESFVRLEELPASDWLADCRGEENAMEITHASGRTVRARGKGAGSAPTTASVMSDIYDLWRERAIALER
jgi:homoserine dehydrogenase